MNLGPKGRTRFFILSVNAPSKSEVLGLRLKCDSLESGVRKSSDLHICILPLSTSGTLPEMGYPPPEFDHGIDTGAFCQFDHTRSRRGIPW